MTPPVLLIIYKRPELTRRALKLIAAAKPCRLFVAADGPRREDEVADCRAARAAVAEFTGDCEVLTNFSEPNLGCGIRVYTGIHWAFSHTEELIILEDDCVPNESFFRFCSAMLERYRDDERVMHISGDNFVGPELSGPYSYYFSKYTHASGWASWRRAWKHFDWSISRWPEAKAAGLLETYAPDPYEREYWTKIFDGLHRGAPDVWDYQWNFACWSQSALAILPAVNLVLNDGWGPAATHTKTPMVWPETVELGELRHPPFVVRNAAADAYTFDRNFGGAHMRALNSPRARFRRAIDPLLRPARVAKRIAKRALRVK